MEDNKLNLFGRFTRIQWLLLRFQQQGGSMGNPHRGQGRVLALLKIKPEISQKELSNILDIRSQSLGELLVKLERNGYITRTPSEKDRRAMIITLTEEGKQAADINSQSEVKESEIFGCLSEEEQKNLSEYLDRIITDLEQKSGINSKDYFDNLQRFFHNAHHGRDGEYFGHNMEGMHPFFGSKGFEMGSDKKDGNPFFNGQRRDKRSGNPRNSPVPDDEE